MLVERLTCAVCGATHSTTLLDHTFCDPPVWEFLESYYAGRVEPEMLTGGRFTVSQCRVCGFIWQRYILDDAGMTALYEHWIDPRESLNKKVHANARLFLDYAHQMRLIAALFPDKAPDSIRLLDFGMGWGYWCQAAQAFGYRVVGQEFAQTRLDYARVHGVPVVCSLAELTGQSFDVINAEQVFEHIPQPLATLEALAALLAPGGVIRIAVPNGSDIVRKLRATNWQASKDALHPLEHINCFTAR
ncbi:MAG: class I SAM-dependent methyltransferase, partial [Chloroflexaceae bacterium]|nr:class I SAM-dependent methyltransferase [Chloroflexaceae bacterium]